MLLVFPCIYCLSLTLFSLIFIRSWGKKVIGTVISGFLISISVAPLIIFESQWLVWDLLFKVYCLGFCLFFFMICEKRLNTANKVIDKLGLIIVIFVCFISISTAAVLYYTEKCVNMSKLTVFINMTFLIPLIEELYLHEICFQIIRNKRHVYLLFTIIGVLFSLAHFVGRPMGIYVFEFIVFFAGGFYLRIKFPSNQSLWFLYIIHAAENYWSELTSMF